jgi:hypothetical protein
VDQDPQGSDIVGYGTRGRGVMPLNKFTWKSILKKEKKHEKIVKFIGKEEIQYTVQGRISYILKI